MVTKKRVTRKVTPKKGTVSPKGGTYLDKGIELIKWVDTPFKLIAVVILASLFFLGYFAWDSRQVILQAITTTAHMPTLKEQEKLLPIAAALQKDTEAVSVVVYKANLVVNSRVTVIAIGKEGRDKSIDGSMSSLFSASSERNAAMVAMLNGEVMCSKLEVSGKTTEWEAKQGATYVCRGSIPPEVGAFAGYVTAGFKVQPEDVNAIKVRINAASTEMAK